MVALGLFTSEAHDYWNKSWEGVIPEGMSYLDYESAKNNEALKELGIPTPYGHRDPYEDFAETFAFSCSTQAVFLIGLVKE